MRAALRPQSLRTTLLWLLGCGVAAALLIGLLRPDWALQAEFARQRVWAKAEVRELTAAGHRWSYLEAGQGPTIVLLHGFVGMKENWLPLMRELRRDFRLVAPDLPGWNASQRIDGADYGVAAQAERVSAFLAALDSPTVLLVGHSMGGHIAGLVAADHPDQLSRLLLMSSAGTRFNENAFARAVLDGDHPFAVTDRASLHRFLRLVFTDPPWTPWPADTALVQRRLASDAFERRVLADLRGADAFRLEGRLADVQTPTLLLWCRDDQVIDVSAEAVFRAGLPRARSVLLDGCGHMPLMAAPDAVANAIRDFIPVVR